MTFSLVSFSVSSLPLGLSSGAADLYVNSDSYLDFQFEFLKVVQDKIYPGYHKSDFPIRNLEEDEKDKIVIDGDWVEAPVGQQGGGYLIGKLLLHKPATVEGLRAVFQQIWKLRRDLLVREVGERLFVFQYANVLERDRVSVSQLWLFHKALLVLREFDGVQQSESIEFDTCPFWVKAFGIPFQMVNERVGTVVGESMRRVLDVDANSGRYLRIRIDMDLQRPFKTVSTLTYQDGEAEIKFDYEKRPDYCWVCGLVDHQESDYAVAVAMKIENGFVIQKYKPDKSKSSFVMGRASVSLVQRQRRGGAINRQGSQSVPAKSNTSITSPFRRHVDSMLLHGRRVARALAYNDVFCEIISKMDARAVETGQDFQGGYNNEDPRRVVDKSALTNVMVVTYRGAEKGGRQSQNGKEKECRAGNAGNSFIPHGENSSGESSSSSSISPNANWVVPIIGGPSQNCVIPGVGPREVGSNLGLNYMVNSSLDGVARGLEIEKGDGVGAIQDAVENSTTEGYDPTSPFVFGTGSSGTRKVRKWKKAARVSEQYSFDTLCHEQPFKVGSKRSAGICAKGGSAYGVDCNGRSVGLALLWMKDECISLLSYSFWHIDVSIGSSDKWQFTGFYGQLDTNRRYESWSLLRSLFHEDFDMAIKKAWPDGDVDIVKKIKACGTTLEDWNQTMFGNLQFNIAKKQKEFGSLFARGASGNHAELDKCNRDLDKLLHQEELLWRQRPKTHWLKVRDRNTRFFHAVASSRKQKKQILSIKEDARNTHTEQTGIMSTFTNYFKGVFTTSNPTQAAIHEVLQHMECRVTEQMQIQLEQPFTAREIQHAAFQMGGSKAPGPDGMSPLFFQKCWSVVGKDVVNYALKFLNNNESLPDVNHTNVVLIPKIDDPKLAKDFRPISLCNVIFRIVSKALANRSCEEVISLLDMFEAASGQKININKSAVLFSANTTSGVKDELMNFLGVQRVLDNDKYLGLPIMIGRSKCREFRFLKDRLQKRINAWNSKLFSKAGKAVMIQAVAQATPVYLMSVFLFPKSFLQELNAMIARFCLVVPRQNEEDRLIWNGTMLGEFTVCSAYHVARRVIGRQELPLQLRSPIWRYIWSAGIMPKIQYFMWRLVWNILPTKSNLNKRGMEIAGTCEVCGGEESADAHVFFNCHLSKLVWEDACPWVLSCIEQWDLNGNFWEFFLEKAKAIGQFDRVCTILWLLWGNSNRALYEAFCSMPNAIVRAATRILDQVCAATSRIGEILMGQSRQIAWMPPPLGVMKINTDASFSTENGEAGLGVVIRDDVGNVIASGSRRLYFIADSLYAEVHAILFGFEMALELGLDRCIVESDSLLAIREINKLDTVFWEGGCLIHEIRELASLFEFCSFQFVNREANMLAHSLVGLRLDNVWCGTLPLDVL
ncbi:hypothetical protein CCACVL1_01552 [Corchorus capsularis]|uniref:Reverse transcriptase n=1 Tax=Corchorus capsularis TaxID=210143 RepID=A0A1R3KHA2_COCAP|nr:hypothetical protein CCACVL1_01552 [Corchorus capsularis]